MVQWESAIDVPLETERGRMTLTVHIPLGEEINVSTALANLDWNLFLAINHQAGKAVWLDKLGIFLAAYAFVLFVLPFIALWFWPAPAQLRRLRQRHLVNATVATVGALLAAHLIGLVFFRPRPFMVHSVTELVAHASDTSFPSDHATFVFAVVVGLWPVLGTSRWLWLALAAAIGVARVFVGVHYPSDVLGGAVVGAIWGALAIVSGPWLARIESPVLEQLARWRLA